MDWSGQTMLQNVWILFLLYNIIVSDWTKAPTKKAYFLGITELLAKVKNSLWFFKVTNLNLPSKPIGYLQAWPKIRTSEQPKANPAGG